jgi:hypothetical protein
MTYAAARSWLCGRFALAPATRGKSDRDRGSAGKAAPTRAANATPPVQVAAGLRPVPRFAIIRTQRALKINGFRRPKMNGIQEVDGSTPFSSTGFEC